MRGEGAGIVTRSTLRQQIADALRDEVLSGRLAPGQEFTVKEIAEGFGVSATPVREALVDLSAQGLLDSVQHRGFRVHTFSLDDFRTMIEARCLVSDAVFGGIAAEALLAGAPGVLASVRRRGEEAQRAAAAGDLNVLIGYDLRFWRELSAVFGNSYLTDFLHRLRVQSWVSTVPFLRRQDDLRGLLWTGHGHLVETLLGGDAQAARAIITTYNEESLRLVEALASGVTGNGVRTQGF
ncbi:MULTISPECIES: GntR family transcriptional regulator [unclassified Streptomyces]|uniref:GntR family transcriptional regulator n=1 Tax=unclassified Streptomyces TaxID=2593676 RepID=UPI000BAC8D72|nr:MULTISPECIES: GntR family transcriptional regulator [unclassified Streptomyces]ASY34078.1 GntR family transcriptional regulator [Streptomyces sp. CLI2509]MYX19064.1 GntR family transcriptional regulator [Streptomyces sp. SID8380]